MKWFSMMRFVPPLLSVGFLATAFAQVQSRPPIELTGANCSLESPPAASAVSNIDGTTLALFPPEVARNYTGCRTIWWLVGQEVVQRSTVKYLAGRPQAYKFIKLQSGGDRETRCEYQDGTVIAHLFTGGGTEEPCPRSETLELDE